MKAILIEKDDAGYRATYGEVEESRLPEGNVTVAVDYSTMNYKDSLALLGKSPIIKRFPLVPGVDFAGTVTESTHPAYKAGDKVIMGGWGVGESHWGGYAQKARVNGDWLTPLPAGLSTRQAMILGTAGYTAMLSVMALERYGVTPDKGDILVTGSTGGVGSVAVHLLAKRGYRVVAATGKTSERAYLEQLGAADILDRAELAKPCRPLEHERWAGAIDNLGSQTLATICASIKHDGVVAACGLAQGYDLPTTVMPFILRGVTLAGINSVQCPLHIRIAAWKALAEDMPEALLEMMAQEVPLSQLMPAAEQQQASQLRGRVVVDVNR